MVQITKSKAALLGVVCLVSLLTGLTACEEESSRVGSPEFSRSNIEGDSDETGASDSDSDGDSDGDGDSDSDGDSDVDGNSDPNVCHAEDFEIEATPSRLMILVDRSGSMAENGKWTKAMSAVRSVVNNYDAVLQLGVDVFPAQSRCSMGDQVLVDTGSNNAQTVLSAINKKSPGAMAFTPCLLGMRQFLDSAYAPEFSSGGEEVTRTLLIISDGEDSCALKETGGNVLARATPKQMGEGATDLCNAGIDSIAVGFGNSQGNWASQLNAIARNGCTGQQEFISATNEQELTDALNALASSAVSCKYKFGNMDQDELDLDTVNIFFDDVAIGYDKNCKKEQGWAWVDDNKNEVEFCGESCGKLQGGTVKKISAEFGCTQIVVY